MDGPSLDLLIINYVEVYPKFRGLGIGVSAIHRTIKCIWYIVRTGSVQALAAAVHSGRRARSKNAGKACSAQRWKRRGAQETEIVLGTTWLLAARQHRNLRTECIAEVW